MCVCTVCVCVCVYNMCVCVYSMCVCKYTTQHTVDVCTFMPLENACGTCTAFPCVPLAA